MRGLEFARKNLSQETWLPTPLLPARSIGSRMGVDLWLKRDDCTPIGSFKLRGALVSMAARAEDVPRGGVYVASVGNYGIAMALAGRRRGVRVTVFVPESATPSKLEQVRLCGGEVVRHGADYDAAKDFAIVSAARDGAQYWQDGLMEEMASGAATIAVELLVHPEPWDAVVVPVGGGSLIKGIATAIKIESPRTQVVGVVAAGAPAMAYAIRKEPWDVSASINTLADGVAVREPIPSVAEELRELLDDIWVVDETAILPAVKTLMELEQVMVEPAAALSIAGLAAHRQGLAGRTVAAVLTGAHLNLELMPRVLREASLL